MPQVRIAVDARVLVIGFVGLLSCASACGAYQPKPDRTTKPSSTGTITKLEVKVKTPGHSYKYWVSSDGKSGGDVAWRLPLKDVAVEVNLKKGEVSLSLTKFPLVKVTANKEGIITFNLTPACKLGKSEVGLGLNFELLRIDAGKIVGVKPNLTPPLSQGRLLYDPANAPFGKGRPSFDSVLPKKLTPIPLNPGAKVDNKKGLGSFVIDEKWNVRFHRTFQLPK
jgi:hypothetical protein